MSAREVCQITCSDRLAADDCEDYFVVNFANTGTWSGTPGSLDAAVQAVGDRRCDCVGEIVDATLARKGGALIVTADHGNCRADVRPRDTDAPHTAHTTYDVECIVVDPRRTGDATGDPLTPSDKLDGDARLADVMPTILEMMGLEKPEAMAGQSMLK